MHCKGCDIPMQQKRNWFIFDSDYKGVIPKGEEELCSNCLEEASLSYWASVRYPLKQQIANCQKYFYKEFSAMENLIADLTTNPEYSSLTVDEIYGTENMYPDDFTWIEDLDSSAESLDDLEHPADRRK